MTAAEMLQQLEDARRATLDRLGGLAPERLDEARTWRGQPSSLRFLLSWLSEGTEARKVRILSTAERLGHPLGEVQRAIMLLGSSRGRLRGALVGLSDADYDRDPSEGEWSVRRVLGHVIATDERYRIAVQYAVERARRGGTGPLRPDEATLPARTGELQSAGAPSELTERLTQERRAVLQTLAGIPDERLTAPTNWTSWDLDVRFRIHRFSAHDREHTIQIGKVRQALGLHQTEPQLLLADAMVQLSVLEATLLCTGDDILNRQPEGGSPTIAALAQESLQDELALQHL